MISRTDFQRQQSLDSMFKTWPQSPPKPSGDVPTKSLETEVIEDRVLLEPKGAELPNREQTNVSGPVYRQATLSERLENLGDPEAPLGGRYVIEQRPRNEGHTLSPTINGQEWLLS